MNYKIKNALKMITSIIIATLLALVLGQLNIRVENILMLYVLSVVIIIMETKEYLWGIIASFICVLTFNYLFTAPYYTFMVDDTNYYISFFIFVVVALIVSSLTLKLQKQILISKQIQLRTNNLYEISSGYLNVSGLSEVVHYGLNCLKMVYDNEYTIYTYNKGMDKMTPYGEESVLAGVDQYDLTAAIWCFQNSAPCGKNSTNYEYSNWNFMPMVSNGKTLGVLAYEQNNKIITEEDWLLIQAVMSQISMAIDREYSNMAEQESHLAAEKELLRNSLLRSISHDLRTPLTGITGSASLLMESIENLDKETIHSLLNDIQNDSMWLSNMVENLLHMTRIQDGRLALKRQEEVVDDIISAVILRIKNRLDGRNIKTNIPEELLIVPMDGQLIIQVLVNLIDNAIKHTTENGHILIDISKKNNKAYFSVIDDGTGIQENVLSSIFESYVTTRGNTSDSSRGIGLGLNICNAIIAAHNGFIEGRNNIDKGAIFTFTLPLD